MAELTAEQRAALKAGLQQASGVQLKTYLQYRELPAGLGDTRAGAVKRVIRYVEQDKLSLEQVHRAITEFQEYSNKRVYLYVIDPALVQRIHRDRFTRVIDSWTRARIVALPGSPRENYSYIDADRIRVNFSETHRVAVVNRRAGTLDWKEGTRVVVLDVDRHTGFVALSFDHPGTVHPHGERPIDYFTYYLQRAHALLGAPLAQFPIYQALLNLEARDLIQIPHGRAKTVDGGFDMTAAVDLRQMEIYAKVRPSIATRDSGRFVWIANPPSRSSLPTAILRDVPTEIYAGTSMVRFTKDCLAEEVEYVLDQIRSHA